MVFYLDINKRTIAFLAALFTTVQCIFWIIGYILYILAYGCAYNHQEFNATALPLDLGSYYLWYLQDDDCIKSGEWINHERNLSSSHLVVLISLGLSWNAALLATSITLLRTFYTPYGHFSKSSIIYSCSVIFVSIWDVLLVVILSVDMKPLLEKKSYSKEVLSDHPTYTQTVSNGTHIPGIFAMPYFTEVYTVLVLLLARCFVFWLLNICFAAYLLAKTKWSDHSTTSPTNQATEKTLWETQRNIPPSSLNETGKDYFGQRSRNQISSVPANGDFDEVSQRWIKNEGRNRADSDFYKEDGVQFDFQRPSTNMRTRGSMTPSEEQRSTFERPVNESDKNMRNGGFAILPNVRRAESITKLSAERKPSFLQSMRESFSKPKVPALKPPDNFEDSFKQQKKHEGFSYIQELETSPTGQVESNPLKVRLKHVHRPSISNEEPERTIMESCNGSGSSREANPYLVSSLSSLDHSYVPRGHNSYPKTPPVSPPVEVTASEVSVKPPPLPPPVDAPKYRINNVTFNQQMSLQEEIRTMRPLKPVKRPAIDTNC